MRKRRLVRNLSVCFLYIHLKNPGVHSAVKGVYAFAKRQPGDRLTFFVNASLEKDSLQEMLLSTALTL